MWLVLVIIGSSYDQSRSGCFRKLITSTSPGWIVLPMLSYDILIIRYFRGQTRLQLL